MDHSEILNYELELANKARDNHMNQLVYKQDLDDHNEPEVVDHHKFPGPMSTSEVLFKRLSQKGPVSTGSVPSLLKDSEHPKSTRRSVHTNLGAPDF